MKHWIFLRIPIFCLLSIINVVFGKPEIIDKIVAIVNNDIILHSDINDKIKIIKYDIYNISNKKLEESKILYQKILDQLINHHLILQTTKNNNMNINYNHNQVNQIINSLAKQHNMTIDQYKIYLKNIGINYTKYLTYIHEETIKKTICEHKIHQSTNIEPNEINQLIQNLHNIDFSKEFKLIYITIELPIQPTDIQIDQLYCLAKSLIEKYKIDNNIKKLMNTYAKKPISQIITIQKTKWTTWIDIPTIFDPYLQTIQKNSIIGPVYSYNGIHLLIVEDVRNKEFIFPIIQTKIKHISLNNKLMHSDVKKELLNIKNNIENENTIYEHKDNKKSSLFQIKNHEKKLEWENIDHFEPIIQKTILSLKKNEISNPIYTDFGWCLIQLIDLKSLDYITMMQERAYSYLLQNKFNENINNWIKELKKTSYIKILNQ